MFKSSKTLNNPQKGSFGYIDYTKKKALITSALSLASVLIIFFTGVIIYNSNKSLFSIIAAVAAIPAAKLITGYIVRVPYKTGDAKLYETLKAKSAKNAEYEAIIGADFIISSSSKSMGITFAYIINGKVICYTASNKTNTKETEKYIKEVFDNEGTQYSQIKVYSDESKFLKNVDEVSTEKGKECTDKRIFEKLCVYSM
ncbi:MAG: hypothetical protein IJF37_09610 [Lachnospiraceae bacterium]|nr:hypothetical protein [Lachnospiraceae bacterium]